jgi:hypothetical protein
MTPYQISQILNAPRDRDGRLEVEKKCDTMQTEEERFTWSWVLRCLPRWLIAKKWGELLNGSGTG